MFESFAGATIHRQYTSDTLGRHLRLAKSERYEKQIARRALQEARYQFARRWSRGP
jgi:hypothetical protein